MDFKKLLSVMFFSLSCLKMTNKETTTAAAIKKQLAHITFFCLLNSQSSKWPYERNW